MSVKRELSFAKQAALERLLSGNGVQPRQETIPVRPAGAVVPISAEQEHVWLHAAMAPDVPLYNEAITIHRRGACDPALLAASFQEFVRRHEIWRTDFQLHDGEIVQRVHGQMVLHLPVTDMTGLPPPAREAEALRIATEDARLPFDLSQAPLLRGRIVKLSETDHRLYITLHHIIFDGVSIYRILVPSLAAIYADLAAGRPAAPADLAPALQYGDYALWRHEQLKSGALARQLAYWTAALAGELPVLRLPSDRPPPPHPTHRGGVETFALTAGLTQRVKQASLDLGITPYGLLLTAFQTLLFRYTGQTDLILGGVMDMRGHRALEPMIGYFLNSLPIRTRPASGMSFRDYSRQTSGAVLGMLENRDVPFSHLVRALAPRREGAAHPLFQVLFSIEPPAPEFAEGWDLTQMDVPVCAAKFDLYLELDERPEGLIGRFLYSADLFEPPAIRRMIGHWRSLIEAAIAEPDCALERLRLLTPDETALAASWNDTARPVPAASLHALFEAQARRTPGAVAIVSGKQRFTYAGLDEQASRIAAWLREAGVAPGMLIALCLERSIAAVAALLGILKAGAAYMPLDPLLPPARLSYFLDEAAADILLTATGLRAVIPDTSSRVLLLEDAAGAASGDGVPPVHSGPDDLAYVLCTSGTTGKPKAVEITHRALVNLLLAMREAPGFAATDSLLAVTTFSFDIAALELFLPLLSGGRVILASREVAADAFLLTELIERSQPTVMQATPSTWRALVDAGWQGLPGLRLLSGGEALPRELADALLRRADSVWNMYGPTETTIWSTIHRVRAGEGQVAIGRPIANTTAFVLDPHGNQLPVGVPGELCLGGAGLARGYRNRLALTQARFTTLPATQGQRVYRTGDIARFNADGTLDWLGRNDEQMKIRGHRIGPAEIETLLETHPEITAALVKPYQEAGGTLGLAAYLVTGPNPLPGPAELRRFLGQSLPDYMLPSRYVTLPALPLTANGKRDRTALPALENGAGAIRGYEPPQGQTEETLARIWAETLGVVQVGRHDNFFELGGHSLLAIRMISRITNAFAARISVATLFAAPTICEMAARVSNIDAPAESGSIVKLSSHGKKTPIIAINQAFQYYTLAKRMAADRSFFVVQLYDPDKITALPDRTLEEIAADYVIRIRDVQPAGPYILMGLCVSGLLAYEIANQLRRAGEQVPLVMLGETWAQGYLETLAYHQRILLRISNGIAYVRQRLDPLLSGQNTFRQFLGSLQHGRWAVMQQILAPLRIRNEPALPNGGEQFISHLINARSNYTAPVTDVDLVLFKSQFITFPSAFDENMGWSDFVTGQVSQIRLPDLYPTMFRDAAAIAMIIEYITPMLNQVDDSVNSRAP